MTNPKLTLARETLRWLKVKTELRAGAPKPLGRSEHWAGHSVVAPCPETTAPVVTK